VNIFDWALRRWFTKRYIRKMITRREDEHRNRLKAAQSLPALERQNLAAELNHFLWEWIEWLHSIEDKELIEQAKRMDIELGEIPLPEPDQFQRPGLWKIGEFGGEVLYTESRQAIRKTIRERMPVYRKEQRELVELYFKGVTLFIGAMGTIIALVAVLKK
jgi:hypothetical protein